MFRLPFIVLALFATLSALATPALAHERREVDKYTLVVGWSEEPALEGVPNAVFLRVTETASGRAVEGLEATLSVTVTFGGITEVHEPQLRAVRGTPGTYTAPMIPTRAGDYTFRFAGRVEDLAVDERFESGPQRFDPIRAAGDLQYPDKIGGMSGLADQVASLDERLQLWRFAVIGAGGFSLTAMVIAIAALVRTRR